jgi:outer membrane protein assembly factor BamB
MFKSLSMPRRFLKEILLLLISILLPVARLCAVEEDWPRFLGPRGNNTSAETGLAQTWGTNGPLVLWRQPVGSGYSAPAVLGQRLVLHHRLQREEVVECFDASTGKSLWRNAHQSQFSDPLGYNNGPRCSPTLTTNRCYTFGAGGWLACHNLEDGKLLWERETAKEWSIPEPFFGVGSTPLLLGDKLIVMIGGQPNSAVVALDASTGKTIWESGGQTNWNGATTIGWRGEAPYHWTGEEKVASYSSPIAATIHGRENVLCFARQGLMSLNPENGDIYFSRWFQSPVNESVNAMCPVVQGDQVLISAAYYRIGAVLLRVQPDGRSMQEIWRSPEPKSSISSKDGPPQPVLEIHWNTPILHNGFLYAFSGRNEPDASFRCVEFATGKLMWTRPERWRPHSGMQPSVYGRGSAILADGRLWVLGEGGKLGLFSPNPRAAEELCSCQVPQLHYPCWTAPVLSHRKLYLRSEDQLICFDVAKH